MSQMSSTITCALAHEPGMSPSDIYLIWLHPLISFRMPFSVFSDAASPVYSQDQGGPEKKWASSVSASEKFISSVPIRTFPLALRALALRVFVRRLL